MLVFLLEYFDKIVAISKIWDKWWNIVAVMLPNITSCKIKMENILSVKVFEWLVFLVCCKIYVLKELGIKESKNFMIWLMIFIIHNIKIMITKKKDLFLLFGGNVKNLTKLVTFKIQNIYA